MAVIITCMPCHILAASAGMWLHAGACPQRLKASAGVFTLTVWQCVVAADRGKVQEGEPHHAASNPFAALSGLGKNVYAPVYVPHR